MSFRRSLLEGFQQVVAALLVEVEEEVFFAGKVIKDRHPRDIGRLGDLVYLDRVEATFEEKASGDVGDLLPSSQALSRLSVW